MPAATPVTVPSVPTVAIVALLLLHVPPVVISVNAVVEFAQTTDVPVTADGNGLIVTVALPIAPHAPAEDCALK